MEVEELVAGLEGKGSTMEDVVGNDGIGEEEEGDRNGFGE